MASSPPPLTRPSSLPDLRPSTASSPRPSLIATLEPFKAPSGSKGTTVPSASPSLSGGFRQKGRRQGVRNVPGPQGPTVEVLPGVFEPAAFNKYITVKTLNDKSIMDLDIFDVHRSLVKACGREPKVTPQRDGSLLVEVASQEEANRLSALTGVPGSEVSCTPHKTLNQSKGVIFHRDLLRYSEERLLRELTDEGVVAVHRFQKKVDGVLTPTPSLLLTFNSLVLPSFVQCAWYPLSVKPYIPNPRRCFHCQSFGHVAQSCRRHLRGLPSTCVNCGNDGHAGECPGPIKCYHCGGPHPASSKECDRYRFEKEILLVRTQERVSFPEAKKRALTRTIRPGVSYASILCNFRRRQPPPASTQSPSTPPPQIQLPQSRAPHIENTMDATSIQQKRSRSEDSLEESPPAKVQSPEPSHGPAEAEEVVTAPVTTTTPETLPAQRLESSGSTVAGVRRSAPVSFPSKHAHASEARPDRPAGVRTFSATQLSQTKCPPPSKPKFLAAGAGGRVAVPHQDTKSAVGAKKALFKGLQKHQLK